MNSTIDNTIIQEIYDQYIANWMSVSCLTLILYATFLKLSQEIEHIWNRSFSLPTLLYVFARYGPLISQGLAFPLTLLPFGRTCNIVADVLNATRFLSYIGVQGLLVARAYSMCKGGKILTPALALSFLSGLISNLYATIVFHGCITNNTAENSDLIRATLAINFSIILSDVIIFSICIWKVWDTWKLKRETLRIQGHHNLVSVLLTQGISRFCFVIVITITGAVVSAVQIENTTVFFLISQGFTTFQNALSSVLVADFTLDLRQLNSAQIEASNISLPTLHFSNVFQHVRQSFVAELATPEDIDLNAVDPEGGADHNHDIPESNIYDIQPAQE